MAKFLTIMSGKGGVGKTTSAINLGLALTKLGLKTVVVDGNLSSPNLAIHLGSAYYPITIHDVMRETHNVSQATYKHPSGLHIIPADIAVESMKIIDFDKLKQQLQELHLSKDYVIIDGSPGLGRESTRLIDLSDEVLVVANQDMPSVIDTKRLIEFAQKFNKTIAGLIVTKYKNKKYKLKIEEIEDYLGIPVLAKVPHDTKFEKALKEKVPYIHVHPKRKASKAYHDLAGRLSGRVI